MSTSDRIKLIAFNGYHKFPGHDDPKQQVVVKSDLVLSENALGIHVMGANKHMFYPWSGISHLEYEYALDSGKKK